jgi:hypothetical protein
MSANRSGGHSSTASEIGAQVTLCHAAEIDRSVRFASGGSIRVSVVVMER